MLLLCKWLKIIIFDRCFEVRSGECLVSFLKEVLCKYRLQLHLLTISKGVYTLVGHYTIWVTQSFSLSTRSHCYVSLHYHSAVHSYFPSVSSLEDKSNISVLLTFEIVFHFPVEGVDCGSMVTFITVERRSVQRTTTTFWLWQRISTFINWKPGVSSETSSPCYLFSWLTGPQKAGKILWILKQRSYWGLNNLFVLITVALD